MILIIVGAYSQLDVTAKMINSLDGIRDCHITVVCGRNAKLNQLLTKQFQSNNSVKILGFVERMDELMASATCIISKAGGLTLAESLALKVPLLSIVRSLVKKKIMPLIFLKKVLHLSVIV